MLLPGQIQPDPPTDIASRAFSPEIANRLKADSAKMYEKLLNRRRLGWRSRPLAVTQIFIYRTAQCWFELRNAGYEPPEEFLDSYPIDGEVFLAAGTPPKYTLRAYNLVRDYYRYLQLCPELLAPNSPTQYVLELSPGGCASWEILRRFGHEVSLAEYGPNMDKAYLPLHEYLGVKPQRFDGSQMPYDFETKSVDYVFCFQAIDAYAEEFRYCASIKEMKRIARKAVIIVFNSFFHLRPERNEQLKGSLAPIGDFHSLHCPDSGMFAIRVDV